MNLVQIQDSLKSMPLQAIQAYLNGANPTVPPYLAAAEMQRRQAEAKKQQVEQGAANGKQPSVKEQLEQAAGLMALQQQRMQQGAQQSAQQAQGTPMPTTEQTPQPQVQPEGEVGMAHGGIVTLPIRGDMFRDGGVTGYADGGMSVDPRQVASLKAKRDAMRKLGLDTSELDAQIASAEGGAVQQPVQVAPMTPEGTYAAAASALSAPIKEATPEGTIEDLGKFANASGMAALPERFAKMEADYEASKKDRGLNNLIKALSSAGSGPAGFAMGAQSAEESDRAADLAHAKQMADYYYSHAKDIYGEQGKVYGQQGKTAGDLRQQQMAGLGDLARSVQQAQTAREQMSNALKQAGIYASARVDTTPDKNAKALLTSEQRTNAALRRQLEKLRGPGGTYGVQDPNRAMRDLEAQIAESDKRIRDYTNILAGGLSGLAGIGGMDTGTKTPYAPTASGPTDASRWGQVSVTAAPAKQ